ncbi:MAG TPA: dihydrolipoyl dehydrogenase [Acidiferrobacter sp.]|nr:dihydrolipoyl dehydrogenase [Acidiferrobacter sp.]
MQEPETIDVLTIGAGGGAYPAAFWLARRGRRVVMVDPKGVLSGNCLAEGCVPSKAVREMAHHLARHRRFHSYGVGGKTTVDYAKIIGHKDDVQRRRYLQHGEELARSRNVELIKGKAGFEDAHMVTVETDTGTRRYSAHHIIVASGSDVFVPPIPGAELCLTSSDFYRLNPTLKVLPSTLTVIGGGYIGVETASFYAALGVHVTLLQRGSQLLLGMDPDMIAMLVPLLDPNIRWILDADVDRIERMERGLRVHYRQGGGSQELLSDQVLMAAGRRPVIPDGLTALGIDVGHAGIVVNSALQTSHPHIYACGDVNGRVPLFHAAVRESLVAAHNIAAGDVPTDTMDFTTVPTTIFTLPAAAYVGMTRTAAAQNGMTFLEAGYEFSEDSRAQIYGETEGSLRLFFEPASLRLMGGWVVGIDADNLIGEIGLACANGLTAHQLAAFADQHPMASEGIGHAARSLLSAEW